MQEDGVRSARTPGGTRYRIEHNLAIELADGTALAANLYTPEGTGRLPTMISLYPYHKDTLIGSTMEYSRRLMVEAGYASLLVEFRGTGRSHGEAVQAFMNEEGDDAREVVEWVAEQDWCDGNVGIWGASYGAITAFKVAAQNPPALKAIVPLVGTGNIYRDYIFPGGIPNALGRHLWVTYEMNLEASPTVDFEPRDEWRGVWGEHLDRYQNAQLPPFYWLEHRAADEAWENCNVDMERIQVPTFLIGGWADVFPSILEDFERINAPKRAVMGPWSHGLPDLANLEPWRWQDEVCAWLDLWMKDKTPAAAPDAVTTFVRGDGSWRSDEHWPPSEHHEEVWKLTAQHRLTRAEDDAGSALHEYASDPTVGADGPLMDPMGVGIGYALVQNRDAAKSLTYQTEPVEAAFDVTGRGRVVLEIECAEGGPFDIVAKIHDVAPTGEAEFVVAGHAHLRPESSEPGHRARYDIQLNDTCYRIPRGHRLQLSLSMADFPYLFPMTTNKTIRVRVGGGDLSSALTLAVSPVSNVPALPAPQNVQERLPWSRSMSPYWRITEDLLGQTITQAYGFDHTIGLPNGASYDLSVSGAATVARHEPDQANVRCEVTSTLTQSDGTVISTTTRTRGGRTSFALDTTVTEDGRQVLTFSKDTTKPEDSAPR
jgi:putative CocE/NonD family hydrolase